MVNSSKFTETQRKFYADLVAEHESNGVQMERGIKTEQTGVKALLSSFTSAAKVGGWGVYCYDFLLLPITFYYS